MAIRVRHRCIALEHFASAMPPLAWGDKAMFERASLAVAAALLLVGLAGRAEATVMIDPDPIIAHDVFIEITPNQNIFVEIFVDGIVGEWVPHELPEPAAITLFGFGLLGLGLAAFHGVGRRRKKTAV